MNLKLIKKNRLLFGVMLAYLLLLMIAPQKSIHAGRSSIYYIVEMIQIMPVIFILTSLIEAWVPKEVIIKSFGEGAGIKGSIFSFLLGSFSAGPIYAAFPICKMLLKKGATISNIVIILSTWAVVKVPMLANEGKFLGLKFMGIRWILTSISIFILAYITSLVVKKESVPMETKITEGQEKTVYVKEHYCVGCGICAKLPSSHFEMVEGKATFKKNSVTDDLLDVINQAIRKCPTKAIDFR